MNRDPLHQLTLPMASPISQADLSTSNEIIRLVHRKYMKVILWYIRKRYTEAGAAECEDLAADTFLMFIQKLRQGGFDETFKFKYPWGEVEAFLFLAAQRRVWNEIRALDYRPSRPSEPTESAAQIAPIVFGKLNADDLRTEIKSGTDAMRNKKRARIIWFFIDNEGAPSEEQIEIFMRQEKIKTPEAFEQEDRRAIADLVNLKPELKPYLTGRRKTRIVKRDKKNNQKNEKGPQKTGES